jgi:AcrR family transcriptional regulator
MRDNGAESPRPGLDEGRIVEAAVRFIDEHGLRELTMRRLGSYLGVEAMALYRYVPGREALLDAVVESVVDELYRDPDVLLESPAGWVDYLQRLAHGLRRIALAHPEVFPLVATRPAAAPWVRPPLRSLRGIESLLRVMTAAGFSDEHAAAVYRAFSSFLLGHLLLEVSAMGVETGPVEEPDVVPVDDLSAYPILRRLEPKLSQDHAAVDFEEALETLLDRIALLLPARSRGRRAALPRNGDR